MEQSLLIGCWGWKRVGALLSFVMSHRQVPRPWLGACVANLYTSKLEKLDELTRTYPHVVKGAIVEQIMNVRTRACVKRTKVCHWTFWSVRKWLMARVLLEKIKKRKRIQTRDTKMKIKKKKRIQTRDRKMKVPSKVLFTLLAKMGNGTKWEGLMNEKDRLFTSF
ncbi:hypothetical protein L195_g018896 [Trifolium pratense]|uniref:Uncharacterized protein n=1 Tax=Trifolium pratense TaxID=57577 RepID=A0A2K3MY49_TRIPR|nr:hypothetical protein L195_g018896 [Trifolium pratense]